MTIAIQLLYSCTMGTESDIIFIKNIFQNLLTIERSAHLPAMWERIQFVNGMQVWNVLEEFTTDVSDPIFERLLFLCCQTPDKWQRLKFDSLMRMGVPINLVEKDTGMVPLAYLVRHPIKNPYHRTTNKTLPSLVSVALEHGATVPTNLLFYAFHGRTLAKYIESEELNRSHQSWLRENLLMGGTPLADLPQHQAYFNMDQLRELLSWNTLDVHGVNEHGMTLLHWAVSEGNADKIKLLLSYGVITDLFRKSLEGEYSETCTIFYQNAFSLAYVDFLQTKGSIQYILHAAKDQHNQIYGAAIKECRDIFPFSSILTEYLII